VFPDMQTHRGLVAALAAVCARLDVPLPPFLQVPAPDVLPRQVHSRAAVSSRPRRRWLQFLWAPRAGGLAPEPARLASVILFCRIESRALHDRPDDQSAGTTSSVAESSETISS
jgi:hypothetical protein